MRRFLVPALLAGALACERAPDAVAPEDSRPLAFDPEFAVTTATFLAPTTIVRAGPAPQVDTIDLGDLPWSRFKGPFYLHVTEHAGTDVSGPVRLDGETVVRLGSLAPGGTVRRRIWPDSASKLVLTLSGAQGGAVTLRIDGMIQPPPQIRILTPDRAAALRLGGGGVAYVSVRGEVCDAVFPIVALSVNGVAQSVTGADLCASFAVQTASPWGMTTVVVEATNSAGRSARRVQSFLRSRYYSAPALSIDSVAGYDSMVDVRWASAVRYEAAGFTKLTSLIPGHVNDVEALGSSFSSFEIGSCGPSEWRVTRGTVSSHIDDVTLAVTSQQILNVAIQYDVTVPFTARYCIFGVNINGSGTLTLSNAVLDADISFAVTPVTGGVEVDLANMNQLGVDTATMVLVGFGSVPGDARQMLYDALMAELQNAIGIDGTALMDSVATIGHAFERLLLPSDGLSSIGVGLSHAGEVMVLEDNGANVAFRTQTAPLVARGGAAPARGSIRSRAGLPFTPAAGDVNEYVSDDFMNQVLWSAWQAGWFDALDLETLADPIDGLDAELYSMLPPVLMPRTGGVRFGWGDARVDATVDPAHFGIAGATSGPLVDVTAFGSVTVDARLRYDTIAHRLVLHEASAEADVQVASPANALLDEVALRDVMAAALEQAALDRLAAVVAAVPLPEADLSGMLGASPGRTLDLNNAQLVRAGRFFRVSGSIGVLN